MRGNADTVFAPPDAPYDRTRVIGTALLIRAVEERLLDLFAQGRLTGTVHTCIGQELSAACVGAHLRPGDRVFSNHRCHGHYLAATGDVTGLIAEVMGRSTGVCGGRGGSQHLCRDGFYSTGVLAGGLPVAAGSALAAQLSGGGSVAVSFLGDGTLGEGLLYEVLNLAALWRLPLLFVLEDNGYAQSTRQPDVLAGGVLERAAAFGIPTADADTWDGDRLWRVAGRAFAHVRGGAGPCFLRVRTYRLRAHSKGDDDRPAAELAEYEGRDPLNRLVAAGQPWVRDLVDRARRTVDEATAAAEAAPEPDPDGPPAEPPPVRMRPARPGGARFADSLHDGLAAVLHAHPESLLLGEDVEAPYGGAFKVTRDLSHRFPGRVRNTPISEAAIVGLGTGLALHGLRPTVEVMFADFLTLATDQLVNQAAKVAFLRGPGGPPVDVVVRAPAGGGRGYGPTHSQTLDRLFLGTPGLRVVAASSLIEPGELIAALGRGGHGPTVLIEHKLLYGRRIGAAVPAGFTVERSAEDFPVVRVSAHGRADVTLLGYGGMCEPLLAACDLLFAGHDVLAQVICPTQVYPLRWARLRDLVPAAGPVVVAEEGQGFAGFGAELLAQRAEQQAGPVRWRRVLPRETPIPAAATLERAALPTAEDIVRAALDLVGAS